jgi:hypothetical protein
MREVIRCSFCGRDNTEAGNMLERSDHQVTNRRVRICGKCAQSAVNSLAVTNASDVFHAVLGISMDAATRDVKLEHVDTGETFEFQVDDLDEVIEQLIEFRNAFKGGDVEGS